MKYNFGLVVWIYILFRYEFQNFYIADNYNNLNVFLYTGNLQHVIVVTNIKVSKVIFTSSIHLAIVCYAVIELTFMILCRPMSDFERMSRFPCKMLQGKFANFEN